MDHHNNQNNFDIINQLKHEMDTIGSRINRIGNTSPKNQVYSSNPPQNPPYHQNVKPHNNFQQPAIQNYQKIPYTTQHPHHTPSFGHNTLQPKNQTYNTPSLAHTIQAPVKYSASPETNKNPQRIYPGTNTVHHPLNPVALPQNPVTRLPQKHVVYQAPVQARTPSPKSITQKGKEENFQDVLFETIEDFEQRRKMYGDSSDLKSIGKLLLPLDVFLLYNEHHEISQEFNEKMAKEKQIVDADVDNFLKEIILMMEKVKEKFIIKLMCIIKDFLIIILISCRESMSF